MSGEKKIGIISLEKLEELYEQDIHGLMKSVAVKEPTKAQIDKCFDELIAKNPAKSVAQIEKLKLSAIENAKREQTEKYELKRNSKAMTDDEICTRLIEENSSSIQYIVNCVFPLSSGGYGFSTDGSVREVLSAQFSQYLNRMPTAIKTFLTKKYKKIFNFAVFDLNKSAIPVDYEKCLINVRKPMIFTVDKSFKPNESQKVCIDMVNDFIEKIVSNGCPKLAYIMNQFIAKVCKGEKSDVCPVLCTSTSFQGAGKSTLASVVARMIGDVATGKPSSKDIIQFNYALLGCPFVLLEETPEKEDFMAFLERLKDMITADEYSYRDLFKSPVKAKCINNFMLTTNNMLKVRDRRFAKYYCSNKLVGDTEYFTHFHLSVEQNAYALFQYFANMETVQSLQKYAQQLEDVMEEKAELLKSSHKFIKDKYILLQKNMTQALRTEIYAEFCSWHKSDGGASFTTSKLSFYRELAEVGIEKTTKDGYSVYTITWQTLLATYKKNKMINDEEIAEQLKLTKQIESFDNFDEFKEEKSVAQLLKDEIKRLKEKYEPVAKIETIVENIEKVEKKKKAIKLDSSAIGALAVIGKDCNISVCE